MARPGLLHHRKFVRLARILASDALACGHLEIIWHACYENGDPKLGTGPDLEHLARWKGDPGVLSNALLLSGFIDEIPGTDEFACHDLLDHAPDYVQKRMAREEERRSKGKTLSDLRSIAGRKGGKISKRQANGGVCLTNGTADLSKTEANGSTPAPAPAPAPAPLSLRERESVTISKHQANGDVCLNGDGVPLSAADRKLAWEQFVFAYPNSSSRDDPEAELLWDQLAVTRNLANAIMAGLSKWKRCHRWLNPGFVHNAKNFLGKKIWLQEPPPNGVAGKDSPHLDSEAEAIARAAKSREARKND